MSGRTPDLSEQVAVVTGGRGDIGGAIVEGLHAAGACVAVADLRPLPDAGVSGIEHYLLDVSDPVQIHQWLDAVQATWGPATIVVPAAATATVATSLAITPEQWASELAVDLSGPFLLAQDAARRLVAADKAGRIVMIGSWAADAPHPHVPAYSVAKAGLRMLTRCLALELAPHQILVNEVAIGVVDAGVSRTTFAAQPHLRARSEAQVPVGHLVGVEEIVGEVLALCDPRRRSMTGSTIVLDGGISLRTALSGEAETRG
jgi:glucose 1-dehydrogenase